MNTRTIHLRGVARPKLCDLHVHARSERALTSAKVVRDTFMKLAMMNENFNVQYAYDM